MAKIRRFTVSNSAIRRLTRFAIPYNSARRRVVQLSSQKAVLSRLAINRKGGRF